MVLTSDSDAIHEVHVSSLMDTAPERDANARRRRMECSQPLPDGRTFVVRLQRLRGESGFTARQRIRFTQAWPDVMRAAVATTLLPGLTPRLPAGTVGLIAFDRAARVVLADSVAVATLDGRDAFPVLCDEVRRRLRHACGRARPVDPCIELMDTDARSGIPYVAAVTPALPRSDRDALTSRFGFTPREGDCVALVSEGLSNDDIARRLGIGRDAVKHYLGAAYRKAGVRTRVQLTALVLKDRV